jgi:uncharacterized protein DUF899
MCGTDVNTHIRERPGMSAFVLEDGVVYHTYSSYGRGVEGLWGMYQWLDRAPKGRNKTGVWWCRHDEYESESQDKGASKTAALDEAVPRDARKLDGLKPSSLGLILHHKRRTNA